MQRRPIRGGLCVGVYVGVEQQARHGQARALAREVLGSAAVGVGVLDLRVLVPHELAHHVHVAVPHVELSVDMEA